MALLAPGRHSSWRAVRILFPLLGQYKIHLLAGFVALLGVDAMQLFIPRLVKTGVDGLQAGSVSQPELFRLFGWITALAVAIGFWRFGWRYFLLGFSRFLERDLRDRLFAHLLTLDRPFFQRRTTGELMALVSNDLAAVQLACGMGLVAAVDALVMGVAALGFMAYIDLRLTLVAVLPMPVLALVARLLSARLHRRFRKVQEQFSQLTEFVRATLGAIRLVKAYTQEEAQTVRFGRLGEEYVRDNLRLALVQGTLFPSSGLVANISLLLVLLFGGRLVIGGEITAGDFVAFISYLFMMTWPMMAIGWVANLFQRGVTSLGRIDAVLEERPSFRAPVGSCVLPTPPYSLELRAARFAYPGQTSPALEGISVCFPPGVTGIVGRTGAGKSALCHLLTRLYPVPDRTFFLNDTDVNSLDLDLVRSLIAYVPQETLLFSDTIGANIALGRPQAGQQEIEAAARAAAIHGEIVGMAKGYETVVGERGVRLSGGQRQRLALARALLLDRPVLVMDDGLSAVDMQTEQEIIRALATFQRGRTCIVVSHRLAPLAEADEIVVLAEGRIADRGGHADLLERNASYRAMYRQQSGPAGLREG